jgi:malonyl-CoA reductase/3-hydroxypropionate dehydrogenase (NADP+)
MSASGRAVALPMDGADAVQVHAAIAAAVAAYGRLDIIVNNAGSSGPKQRLEDVPITDEDLAAQQAAGVALPDSESALGAARNLLGMAWTVTRTALPYMKPGATIINVTTIFSRTEYFGRAPYVVPKAAFNALSRNLAVELGPRGIRVNTVLPGPIDSDRIRNVFAAMDKLRHGTRGTTAREFIDRMTLARDDGSGAPAFGLPSIRDVANAIVFLGSDEAAAFNAHEFEVDLGLAAGAAHGRWHRLPRAARRWRATGRCPGHRPRAGRARRRGAARPAHRRTGQAGRGHSRPHAGG